MSSGTDKFDGEELAIVFDEIFDMFSTDEPNAKVIGRVLGSPNMYDESDYQSENPIDIFLIEIGDPTKQQLSSGGDARTSRTWFLVKPEVANVNDMDTGNIIEYRNKRYIIRNFEVKNIRGVDLIGYGMMERYYASAG